MQPEEQLTEDKNQTVTKQNEACRLQIKNVDMSEEKQHRAVELAKNALGQQLSPREIAGHVKKEFDRCYGPAWHCIVGKAFGSFVTHEANSFMFFYLDNWAIMLFKTA